MIYCWQGNHSRQFPLENSFSLKTWVSYILCQRQAEFWNWKNVDWKNSVYKSCHREIWNGELETCQWLKERNCWKLLKSCKWSMLPFTNQQLVVCWFIWMDETRYSTRLDTHKWTLDSCKTYFSVPEWNTEAWPSVHKERGYGYTDADWAGDTNDRKSTSGYMFMLGGAAVSWKQTRQSMLPWQQPHEKLPGYVSC